LEFSIKLKHLRGKISAIKDKGEVQKKSKLTPTPKENTCM
jgi:hypothetical protein